MVRTMSQYRATWRIGLIIIGIAALVVAGALLADTRRHGVVTVEGCPPLQQGTTGAADYSDIFIWKGLTYMARGQGGEAVELGVHIGTIGCSIAELTATRRELVAPPPWPDRTATLLPSRTPVFVIRSVSPGCQLAVRIEEVTRVYTAIDPNSVQAEPIC